jgi:release factor glutamine methyltransferase
VTLGEALRSTVAQLAEAGVDAPQLDAELIFSRVLGRSRLQLYADSERELGEAELAGVRKLVERRASREPLAYVLGEWGFRRLTLQTDARALVPRPETEIVVERALLRLAGVPSPRVVDVGTGSGAIALSLAQECPGAHVTATDVSAGALQLAAANAANLGLPLELVETDLLDGLAGPFDLVVSNPPYVAAEELESLEPEVREWEPRLALVDRGQTARLVEAAKGVLGPGAWLVVECHEAHARELAIALTVAGYEGVTITVDLAGRERVVEGRWAPSRSTTS